MRFFLAVTVTFLVLFVSPAVAGETKELTLEQFRDSLPKDNTELDLEDFLALKKEGQAVIIDVRSKESFDRHHLKGSVNAPLTELTEKTLSELAPDKNMPVVLVCSNSFHVTRMIPLTTQAYPVLKASGYTRIYNLNLWRHGKDGKMRSEEEQEKALPFEGTGDIRLK